MSLQEIYLLNLNDDGSPDIPRGYVYLPPPSSPRYLLRFVIGGSSSICHSGTLWVNIPEDDGPIDPAFRGLEYVLSDMYSSWSLLIQNIDYGRTSTRIYMLTYRLLVRDRLRFTSLTPLFLTLLIPGHLDPSKHRHTTSM